MSNHLERDIFGGSDSELSSEEEEIQVQVQRPEKPRPSAPQGDYDSSGESADDYVQEKRVKKKVRRQREEGEGRPVQRKRKRKQTAAEPDFESMDPTEARRLQLRMKIDSIIKTKRTNRPKKRKGDADEEVLDRFADEEVSQLREEMLRAAAEDDDANREKLPATSKLKLLPRVKEVLQKSSLAQSIMDNNLLEGVRRWLEPLPDRSLPALNIQSFFFEQLMKMYIDTNSLKESGLGRVVLFYTKCKRVQTTIQRMANELVSAWSRPIVKRSSSYRDRHVPIMRLDEQYEAAAASQQNRPRLKAILQNMREEDKLRVRKNAVQIPDNRLGTYSIAPRDNLQTKKANVSASNDSERRRRVQERLKSFMRKAPGKN